MNESVNRTGTAYQKREGKQTKQTTEKSFDGISLQTVRALCGWSPSASAASEELAQGLVTDQFLWVSVLSTSVFTVSFVSLSS